MMDIMGLWEEIQPSIRRLVRKYTQFSQDPALEEEDFVQTAFLFFIEAMKKYSSIRGYDNGNGNGNGNGKGQNNGSDLSFDGESYKITKMKISTYVHWYTQKALERGIKRIGIQGANFSACLYHVFDRNGNYIETLTHAEYQRKRKKYRSSDFEIRTEYIYKSLQFLSEDDNNDVNEQIGISFDGYEGAVREILEEEIYKHSYYNGKMRYDY